MLLIPYYTGNSETLRDREILKFELRRVTPLDGVKCCVRALCMSH